MTTHIAPPAPQFVATAIPGLADPNLGMNREYPGNRFVYSIISPRAGGLTIGINMNPDKYCNFNCAYCEVDRRTAARAPGPLDVNVMSDELEKMLGLVHSGELNHFHAYRNTPGDLMRLRHIALSGDGEPTLCPNFIDVIQAIVHIRALGRIPFYKIVLLTNATGMDLKPVQEGLKLFTKDDEIWAKLDAGSQHYFEAVNGANCLLEKTLENILAIARERPVVIQSMFPQLNGREPSVEEIEVYAERLKDLKNAGAKIPLVQIYSATRQPSNPKCEHLPLKSLVKIARRVKEICGLNTQVF